MLSVEVLMTGMGRGVETEGGGSSKRLELCEELFPRTVPSALK